MPTQQKYTTKVSKYSIIYLTKVEKNFAFNKQDITVDGTTTQFRGFVGVRNSASNILEGAFCTGTGSSLESIVFSLAVDKGSTNIELKEVPNGWPIKKVEKHIKVLLAAIQTTLHDRLMAKLGLKPKKQGGQYLGKRLEAHPWSTEILPANHFQTAPDLFSQAFAELATQLMVTYK